jgi:chemotaxis-related protein WspD
MRASLDDCWRRIGVAGNRQCPELSAAGHCRNCSRYADLAVQTLDRAPPEGHVQLATELLAGKEESEARDTLAVILFRLTDEWLALPAEVFEEVSPLRPIRPIPHRASGVLLGLVNVRGSLQLCVSMAALLGLEQAENAAQSPGGAGPRLLVIGREGHRWAFAVDEVCGIHRVAPQALLEVPATTAKIPSALAKAIFAWRQTHAGLLDDQRLFEALRRSFL